jgi:hypothetical protein
MKLANSYFLLLLSLAVMSPLFGMEEQGKKEKKQRLLKKGEKTKSKKKSKGQKAVEQHLKNFIKRFEDEKRNQNEKTNETYQTKILQFQARLGGNLDKTELTHLFEEINSCKKCFEDMITPPAKMLPPPGLTELKTNLLLELMCQPHSETVIGQENDLSTTPGLPLDLSEQVQQPLSPKSRHLQRHPSTHYYEPPQGVPIPLTIDENIDDKRLMGILQETLDKPFEELQKELYQNQASNDNIDSILTEALLEVETSPDQSSQPSTQELRLKSPPARKRTKSAHQPTDVQPKKSVADLAAAYEKKDGDAKTYDQGKDKKTTPRKTSNPKPLTATTPSIPDSPISLDEQKLFTPDTTSPLQAASSRTTDEKLETTIKDNSAEKSGDRKQTSKEQILPPPSSDRTGDDTPSDNQPPSVAKLKAQFEEKDASSKTSKTSQSTHEKSEIPPILEGPKHNQENIEVKKGNDSSFEESSKPQPLTTQHSAPATSPQPLLTNNPSPSTTLSKTAASDHGKKASTSDDPRQSVSERKPIYEPPTTTEKNSQGSQPSVPSHQLTKSSNPYWMRGLLYLGGTGICTLLGLYGFYKLLPDDPSRPWFVGTSIAGGLLATLMSVENFGYKEESGGPITNLLKQKK